MLSYSCPSIYGLPVQKKLQKVLRFFTKQILYIILDYPKLFLRLVISKIRNPLKPKKLCRFRKVFVPSETDGREYSNM